MQTINTNITGVHCKVSCNNQYRRFLFVGTEFSSLFSQVQQLLSLNKEFVLKYKDNEGDLISISSNEELACALSFSESGVLRLSAVVATDHTQPTTVPEPNIEFPAYNFHGRHGRKCHGTVSEPNNEYPAFNFHGKHGVKWHGRGNYGGCGRFAQDPYAPRCGPEAFKSRMTNKRDFIQSHLAELAKSGELNPDQQHRQEMLQAKLRKIESRLVKFEEGGCGRWEKRACKWEAKAEKHKNKEEKKMKTEEYGQPEKREKRKNVISEETQAQIVALKTQILALKPGFKEVKYQLKAKKAAMKEAKAKGSNVEQLANEIAQLKEVHKAHKNQIRPLKEQIHALKHA